jgi:hypothetical protein
MKVVGAMPRLPQRLAWLTTPIPAQRLAAWRIGVGLAVLIDALLFYAPNTQIFYGPGSLAEPKVFAERFAWPHWNWSVFNWLPVEWGASIGLGIWIVAALALVFGIQPRFAAAVAWALSLSLYNTNFYLHNSGDRLRHFLLLLLIFAKTDAVWSIRRRALPVDPTAFVPGWPARIMLIQMVVMYFMNGVFKMRDPMWWNGSVLWYVDHDPAWARWSPLGLPLWMTQGLTWATLIWEVGFVLWIMLRWTRVPALIIGVIFHVYTFFHLELAAFPLYALCLYLPLAPWERWVKWTLAKPPAGKTKKK